MLNYLKPSFLGPQVKSKKLKLRLQMDGFGIRMDGVMIFFKGKDGVFFFSVFATDFMLQYLSLCIIYYIHIWFLSTVKGSICLTCFPEMYRRFCTWGYIVNTGGYWFWSKTISLLSCRAILFSQHQGCRLNTPQALEPNPLSGFRFGWQLLTQKNKIP